ncbi:MAG: hypothetical protein WBM44_29345 [Waterburya sp.]
MHRITSFIFKLYKKFANLIHFYILFIFLFFVLAGFQWRASKLMLGVQNKLLDSRFWYNLEDVRSFFESINVIKDIDTDIYTFKTGLNLYATTQITLDLLFPIIYGTLFAVFIIFLYKRKGFSALTLPKFKIPEFTPIPGLSIPEFTIIKEFRLPALRQLGLTLKTLILIPKIAALFDILENFATAALAISYPKLPFLLVHLAALFTLMKWLTLLLCLLAIGYGLFVWCVRNRQNIYLFWKDYIFYLRVPIYAGILLLLFPILANTLAAKLIQNLFVMRGVKQLVVAMMGATMAALMVSFTFERIFDNAPRLFNVDRFLELSKRERYNLATFLIIVNWLFIILSSWSELKAWVICGVIVALFLSVLIIIIIEMLGNKIRQRLEHSSSHNSTQRTEEDFLGIALGIVGLVIYILTIFLYQPGSYTVMKFGEAPALVYIYLLIWIITGVLGMLTSVFDRFRIPIVILLVLVSGFGYWAFGVDHYYELSTPKDKVQLTKVQIKEQEGNNLKELKKAFDERLKNQPKDNRTLVVVTASGGGIQASGWTSQVLGGLQEELGISFTQATGLISSVSGGSVGTMYFLDAFDDTQGYPVAQNKQNQKESCIDQDNLKFQNQALNNIFCNATEDWLDAVGWGIAYPDLLRLTGWFSPIVDFISDKYTDRGSALEQDWQMKMRDPKNKTFLSDWRRKSLRGEIPIPVFNATLVEDGRRFLISPMKFITGTIIDLINDDDDRKVLDFPTLYPDFDLNVTTAARLSATFPYVSPLPRNDKNISYNIAKNEKFYGNYHIADGGYFDASGLFTAIELIDERFDSFVNDLKIKRFLFLQINAFPKSKLGEGSKGDKAWLMESIGPLTAAYAVRDSTQISRNLKEIELLKKRVDNRKQDEQKINDKQKIEIESFTIYFPEGYKQPLSWRLTKQQKENLKFAWKDVQQTSNFQELKKTWHDKWKIPSEWKTQKKDEQKS